MSRWFRLYSEVVNDPKVQKLPCEDFRAWINILCLCAENDGRVPSVQDVSFALRLPENGVVTLLERLSNGGLIDRANGGPSGWHYAPHAWDKRQYKSDTSTDRVKRFRKRSATVSETPPEAETDTEQKIATNVAIERPPKTIDRFDEFWRLYPRKIAKAQAHRAYLKALKETDHATLIAGLSDQIRWGVFAEPKFSPHPATWLNAGRWSDERDTSGKGLAGGQNARTGRSGVDDIASIVARRHAEDDARMAVPGGQASIFPDHDDWSNGAIEGEYRASDSEGRNGYDPRFPPHG